jgi:DNA-binding NarL/FixJ family response regulator
MISAIAGTELVQKTRLINDSDYVKEGIAFVAAPGCAFVLTYMVVAIIGKKSSGGMEDMVVIAAAILFLAAIAFAGYARRQQRVKVATEKLVYSQQQQIYENSRALNDMELKVVISENQALHNAVEMKRQEVMNVALSIVEQKEYLQSLNEIVNKLATSTDEKEREGYISDLSNSLRQRLSYDSDVDSQYFYAQAEYLHEDFNAKLSENFPDLTPQERRLATLLRLGFSSKYIATLMNITVKSVEISRYRLRQKLGLGKGDNLVNFNNLFSKYIFILL